MSTSLRQLAVAATVALAALTAAGAASADERGPVVRSSGRLADLQGDVRGPFVEASGAFQLVVAAHGSHGLLRVRHIGPAAEGATFGAHLHMGPCVNGDGAAAQGHYNTDVVAGVPVALAAINEHTEMWLDFTVVDGAGSAVAHVPFVPLAGARSVVVHARATDHHTGLAGARLACLPVVWQ